MFRVLLAEDDRVTRKLLDSFLRGMDCAVVHASTGLRAWHVLEDNPNIGMVVADIVMPDLAGHELLDRIRADERFASLYVTLISGRVSVRDVAELLEAGATSFLAKPISSEQLRIEVERARSGVAQGRRADAGPCFDFPATLRRVDGDRELLIELAETFVEDYRVAASLIAEAVTEGRAEVVQRSVHAIRGSASVFVAPRVAAASSRLEAVARAEDLDALGPAFEKLRAAGDALVKELEALAEA